MRAGENRGRLIGVFAVTCAWAAVAAPQALADSFVVNSNADPGGDGVCTRGTVAARGGHQRRGRHRGRRGHDHVLLPGLDDDQCRQRVACGHCGHHDRRNDGDRLRERLACRPRRHGAGGRRRPSPRRRQRQGHRPRRLDFLNVGILVNGSGAVLDELRVGTDEVGAMDEGNGATASPSSDSPSGRRSRSTASSRETGGNGVWTVHNAALGASVLRNNTIGMNAMGTAPIPNDGAGVSIEALTGNASSNVIGGTSAGEGNLIAGTPAPASGSTRARAGRRTPIASSAPRSIRTAVSGSTSPSMPIRPASRRTTRATATAARTTPELPRHRHRGDDGLADPHHRDAQLDAVDPRLPRRVLPQRRLRRGRMAARSSSARRS